LSKPKFIAGAVCDACGSLDRIVVEQTGSGLVKHCVQCGDSAVLRVDQPIEERVPNVERIIIRGAGADER